MASSLAREIRHELRVIDLQINLVTGWLGTALAAVDKNVRALLWQGKSLWWRQQKRPRMASQRSGGAITSENDARRMGKRVAATSGGTQEPYPAGLYRLNAAW
jgi:hypothetical protein